MRVIRSIAAVLLVGLLAACSPAAPEKRVLYWVNPMNPVVRSDKPMKDSMGMDYLPVYEEQPAAAPAVPASGGAEKKILYWANPMDPTVKSDKPMKDSMGMDYQPVYAEGAEPAADTAGRGILLRRDQEALIGVATARVAQRTFERNLTTIGRIAYNEKRSALVSARFPGRIERLEVNFTGAAVGAGEPLLIMYSPALVTAQQELLQADNDRKSGGASAPLAERIFESTRGKLRLWGLADTQIQAILEAGKPQNQVPILSPISGTVVKMNVLAGQYVEEGAVLYELSDLSKVWMEAEIYEQDLAAVSLRSSARMTPLSFPERVYNGPVSFISPSIDPATRTSRIRVELDNAGGLLKPGMFVSALISTPGGGRGLAVPEAALLDTGSRRIVYVKTAQGRYAAREVTVKPKAGGFYPLVSGLAEGEEVVVQANFLIDSESQLKGTVE